ncbi:hypothetical protein [Cohnella luojiensis]|uniref:Uncharacterized protein n=1 Tax=Cohnella luojiensis TaxID=652876 RepID=A0A4Y8LW46_9BACL|nr:hypothetical protein [Cohnella luojiensis]TFE25202.1 hypothetical protein E2980_14210 [Cohnella luojiensis]
MKTVLLFIMILTANYSPIISLLKGEDVASMQIVRNMPGEQGHIYKNTDQSGKTTITKVIGWINTSKPVSGPAEFGKYPMLIKVQLNDGRLIIVSQAYKWFHGTMADGRGISHSAPIKNEIVIRNGSNMFRAKSLELYGWIEEVCKQE